MIMQTLASLLYQVSGIVISYDFIHMMKLNFLLTKKILCCLCWC